MLHRNKLKTDWTGGVSFMWLFQPASSKPAKEIKSRWTEERAQKWATDLKKEHFHLLAFLQTILGKIFTKDNAQILGAIILLYLLMVTMRLWAVSDGAAVDHNIFFDWLPKLIFRK